MAGGKSPGPEPPRGPPPPPGRAGAGSPSAARQPSPAPLPSQRPRPAPSPSTSPPLSSTRPAAAPPPPRADPQPNAPGAPSAPSTPAAPAAQAPPPPSSPPSPSASSPASSPSESPSASEAPRALPNVHTHFASERELHDMQPQLEAADLRRSLAAVTGKGGDGAALWAYMYEGVQRRLLGSLLQPLRAAARQLIASGPVAAVQETCERVVREHVEQDFDSQEFLEGAREAVGAFYDALGAGDEEALRRMASEQVVEAVKRDRQELLANKRLTLTKVDATVNDAVLGQVSLWGADSVRALDAAWASTASEDTSQSWLVASVYLEVKLACEYKMPGVGPINIGDGKSLLPVIGTSFRRRGAWLFARGPLSRGRRKSLDCSWKLLAWW